MTYVVRSILLAVIIAGAYSLINGSSAEKTNIDTFPDFRIKYGVTIFPSPNCADADYSFDAIKSLGSKIISVNPGKNGAVFIVTEDEHGFRVFGYITEDGKQVCTTVAKSESKSA